MPTRLARDTSTLVTLRHLRREKMSDLLETAIAAKGGWERWQLKKLTTHVSVGGGLLQVTRLLMLASRWIRIGSMWRDRPWAAPSRRTMLSNRSPSTGPSNQHRGGFT